MYKKSGMLMAVATLVLAAFSTVTMAADNNVGTWKLNLAKSTFSGPAPKSQTLKIVSSGANGVKYVADGVDAAGKPFHWEFDAQYDGKFVPFTGNPDADMLNYKRIDANTVESTTQVKGKVTLHNKAVVSADGKIRTLTQIGKSANGQDINNVTVYDRQ